MIRRLALPVAAVVVPLAVVVFAGWRFLANERWWNRRLQEAIALQAAQTLGAEVKVGSVEGDPLTGLRLKDVAISEGGSLAEGVAASADEIDVKYDLRFAIRHGIPPLDTVSEVRVRGLRARIARGRDGKLNIDRLLAALRRRGPGLGRFRGRVIVERSEVAYSDLAPSPPWLSGTRAVVTDLGGSADFADPKVVRWQVRARGAPAPFATAQLEGTAGLERRSLCARGALVGGDLRLLYGLFVHRPEVQVLSGAADLRGSFCLLRGRLLDYAAVGRVRQVTAEAAALRGQPIMASADLSITPAGVQFTGGHASVMGAAVDADGAVFGFPSPSLDVRVVARNVDPDRWSRLSPRLRRSLPPMSGAASVRLAGRITGPFSDPEVSLAADFPAPVAVTYSAPPAKGETPPAKRTPITARARGLVVQAALPDARGGDAAVRLAARELTVGDLGPLLPAQEYLRELRPDPLRNVKADLYYSNRTAATAGRLRIGQVNTEHGEVLGVEARYAVVGKAIRVRATVGSALGAELAADALIDVGGKGKKPSLWANLDASALDLTTAASVVRYQRTHLAGAASASGVLALHGDQVRGAAQVRGHDVKVGRLAFDRAEARVGITREGLSVRYAGATGPFGTWWAKGAAPFHEPASGEFAIARLPLEQAQAAFERPSESAQAAPKREPTRLTGSVFLHGRLGGERGRRSVQADVAGFDVGADKWKAAVLTASVEATRERLRLWNLLARHGSTVAAGDLLLADLHWPAGSAFGPPAATPGADPEPPDAFDGTLSGHARIAGFDLAQLGEYASLPEDLSLSGAAALDDVEVSGTLRAPHARGSLSVTDTRAHVADSGLTVGPLNVGVTFEGDRDQFEVREGTALSAGAGRGPSARFSGKLGGWNTDEGPWVDGRFSAARLPLIAASARTSGPLIEGALDEITDGTVVGPLRRPGPTVSARASARELRFGRREVRQASATIAYRRGAWEASATRFQVAGGEISVPLARYDPEGKRAHLEVGAKNLQAKEVLLWAGDVALQAAPEPDAPAARDRFYSLAHRLRAELGLGSLTLDGRLEDLGGRLENLAVKAPSLDRKPLPTVRVATDFSGLNLASTHPQPDTTKKAETPDPIARLHLDNLSVDSQVRGGSIDVEGSVHWDGEVQVTAQADLVPLSELAAWLPDPWALGGRAAVTAQAKGPRRDPDVTASVEVFDPTIAGVSFDLLQATRIEVRRDAVVLVGGVLKHRDREIQASGSFPFDRDRFRVDPDGPLALTAKASDFPLPVVLELADEFTRHRGRGGKPSFWKRCQATGSLTASLSLSGTFENPVAEKGGLYIDPGATFRLDSWPEGTKLADVRVDTLLRPPPSGAGAIVEALDVRGRLDQTEFALQGQTWLSHLAPDALLRNRIDPEHPLVVTAKSPGQRLPGGTVAMDLDAAVKVFTDPSGWQVVAVDRARASLGRGSVSLSGRALVDGLSLADLGQMPCALRLEFNGAQVTWRPHLTAAQLDGVLTATKFASRSGRPVPAELLGLKAAPRASDPTAPVRLASVARDDPSQPAPLEVTRAKVNIPLPGDTEAAAVEAAGGPRGRRVLYGFGSDWPAPTLDIGVAAGSQVQLTISRLQAMVSRDREAVRLTGTPQAPTVQAHLTVDKGRLSLLRGDLALSQAGVELNVRPAPDARAAPGRRQALDMTSRLWGRAEGNVNAVASTGETLGPVHVTVEVSGGLPPDQHVTTTSNPPLDTEEINRLLALSPLQPGPGSARAEEGSTNALLARTVGREVFRTVLGPIEREVTSALGLSELSLTLGINQPMEFRVGKYLVKDLLLSYRRVTGGTQPDQFDLDLSYQIKPRYQLTLHTDERGRKDVRVEYRWRF